MKILWLDINSSYSHSSLALPALHAQIMDKPISKECEWSVVRGSIKSDEADIIEKAVEEMPDIIFSTLWLFTHEYVISVLTRIKAILPDAVVVLGGPEFLGDNRKFLIKNDFVDAVFRGEGEEFLEQWLPIYNQKNRWCEVTGLCYLLEKDCRNDLNTTEISTIAKEEEYKDASCTNNSEYLSHCDNNIDYSSKECSIIKPKDRVDELIVKLGNKEYIYNDNGKAVIKNFAALRYPEESPFFVTDKSFVQLETTRGCFNSCRFCVSGTDKPIRSQSIEQIRERVEHFMKMGISHVRLLDRTFNGNNRRSIAMLDMMKEYRGKLAFHLEMHPSLLNEELRGEFEKMPAGLLHLEAGIQSLRQEVLDACTRNGNVVTALSGLKFLFSLSDKMETHTDLIAGLPLYTYDDLVEDARKLVIMNSGEVQLETLKVLPGTEMRRLAEEFGLKYSQLPPYEILATPYISYKGLKRAMLLSRLLDVYFNHSVWRDIFREIALNESTGKKQNISISEVNNQANEITTDYKEDKQENGSQIERNNRCSDIEQKSMLEQCINYFWNLKEGMFNISLEKQAKMLYGFLKARMPQLISMFQKVWIENGINLNTLPDIEQVLPYQSYLEEHFPNLTQTDRGRHRCYKIITKEGVWIVLYDRSVSQTKPTEIICKLSK